MVDFNTLITLLSTIFLTMMAGYVMTKIGLLPYSARGVLSDIVIDYILPCNIIVSFMIEFNSEILRSCLLIIIIAIGIEIFSFIVGYFFYSRKDLDRHLILHYATFVSNAGFLGNPIAQGLYGDIGLLYASVYLIPVRILMWSAGVSMYSGTRDRGIIKKVFTHPCIVAVGIGLIIMILQIPIPSGIENALRTVSNCTTAMSMLVIGNILAEINFRDVINRDTIWYSIVRLLIIPVAVFFACRMAGIPQLVTEVSTVLAGMPAPASSALLASKYHGDEVLAAKIIFLSTALSLVSIPIVCLIMKMI